MDHPLRRKRDVAASPRQAAAEAAAAAPKFYGHQIVVGLRQARTGKSHQYAALRNPDVEPFAQFRRQPADVGEYDHRQFLIEELRDRHGGRGTVAKPDVGKRCQRAGEIERRCQQRLRGVGGRSAGDADGASAPALVEQLHGAGRAFAGDFKPRDIVAQLDRQVECSFGLAVLRPETEMGFADRRVLLIQRTHDTGVDAARIGAQHFHRHLRSGVFGGGERMGRRRAAFENGQGAVLDRLAEAFDEFRRTAGVDAVGQPYQFAVAGSLEEARDGGKGLDAFDRVRFGRQLPQRHARGAGRRQRDVARRFGQRHDGDAAAVAVGTGDQFIGGLEAGVPARRRTPAVIEQDHQRRAAAGCAGLRIPRRSGGGDDDKRGGQQAQRGQPPRRARRGFLLRRDVKQ